jgi:hypothetical protein
MSFTATFVSIAAIVGSSAQRARFSSSRAGTVGTYFAAVHGITCVFATGFVQRKNRADFRAGTFVHMRNQASPD